MDLERRGWVRGIWETIKEIFLQTLMNCQIQSSPILVQNQMCGFNIIVTGATSGIGLHTARELAFAGAHVVMACRNVEAATDIAQQWAADVEEYGRTLQVEVMGLDLLCVRSVRQFVEEWDQRQKPLHILINNAGILLMGEPQKFSKDGIEQHMQVNHVAPALLTFLLLPSMLRANASRIVNVSSVAHHWGVVDFRSWKSRVEEQHKFNNSKAYGSSKLVNLMFLKALARKLLDQGWSSIECVAVHPGIATTNLVPGLKKKSFWTINPSEGAKNVLYCATSAHVTGNLVHGFVYYRSNHKVAKTSPQAGDMEACIIVWEKTLKILGLNVELPITHQN